MAVLPNSSQENLLNLASNNRASVFACDGADTFYTWETDNGNEAIFMHVWQQVLERGRYRFFDWTVKVDADALLIPSRLRQHLAPLQVPIGEPIYFKNSNVNGKVAFKGSLEVFSRAAVQMYLDNKATCEVFISMSAEDLFIKACLDSLGAHFLVDVDLLGDPGKGSGCSADQHTAFHPLDNPDVWQCCHDLAMGITHALDKHGQCQLQYRIDLDAKFPPLV